MKFILAAAPMSCLLLLAARLDVTMGLEAEALNAERAEMEAEETAMKTRQADEAAERAAAERKASTVEAGQVEGLKGPGSRPPTVNAGEIEGLKPPGAPEGAPPREPPPRAEPEAPEGAPPREPPPRAEPEGTERSVEESRQEVQESLAKYRAEAEKLEANERQFAKDLDFFKEKNPKFYGEARESGNIAFGTESEAMAKRPEAFEEMQTEKKGILARAADGAKGVLGSLGGFLKSHALTIIMMLPMIFPDLLACLFRGTNTMGTKKCSNRLTPDADPAPGGGSPLGGAGGDDGAPKSFPNSTWANSQTTPGKYAPKTYTMGLCTNVTVSDSHSTADPSTHKASSTMVAACKANCDGPVTGMHWVNCAPYYKSGHQLSCSDMSLAPNCPADAALAKAGDSSSSSSSSSGGGYNDPSSASGSDPYSQASQNNQQYSQSQSNYPSQYQQPQSNGYNNYNSYNSYNSYPSQQYQGSQYSSPYSQSSGYGNGYSSQGQQQSGGYSGSSQYGSRSSYQQQQPSQQQQYNGYSNYAPQQKQSRGGYNGYNSYSSQQYQGSQYSSPYSQSSGYGNGYSSQGQQQSGGYSGSSQYGSRSSYQQQQPSRQQQYYNGNNY